MTQEAWETSDSLQTRGRRHGWAFVLGGGGPIEFYLVPLLDKCYYDDTHFVNDKRGSGKLSNSLKSHNK